MRNKSVRFIVATSDRELAAKRELTNLVIANNVFETQIAPHIGKPIINANGSIVTTYLKVPTRSSKSESEIVRFGESTEYQYESSSIYQALKTCMILLSLC